MRLYLPTARRFLLVPVEHEKPCTWVTRPESREERLAWMQAQVGGYIEHLRLESDGADPDGGNSTGADLWVNEEGQLLGLAMNYRASDLMLWYFGLRAGPVVGPVLVEIRGTPSRKLNRWLADVAPPIPKGVQQ